MKISELRKKNVEELRSELLELAQEQFKLRMQKGAGQVARPHTFKKVRRAIAQIKTLLKQQSKS